MDVVIQKSRKGTQLNDTYYFRKPPPRAREHMTLLRILPKDSKNKPSRHNLNSKKFQSTNKIRINQSSKHIAMISYDHFNQIGKNSLPNKSLAYEHGSMNNDIKIQNQNIDIYNDIENIPNIQSKIENTTSDMNTTSSKSFSTVIHKTSSGENKNIDDEERIIDKHEKEICDDLENIFKRRENFENVEEQPLKTDTFQEPILDNNMKPYHHKQQLYVQNPNLIKEKKRYIYINNFEKISDNNNEESHMEKSWWRLIIDFFTFFFGKKDCNTDKYKNNVKQFKPEATIAAKPGYPDIYNAYKLSLGQNITSDYHHYEDFNNLISKKISKKKKKINNNHSHEKSKMRKMSSPLC